MANNDFRFGSGSIKAMKKMSFGAKVFSDFPWKLSKKEVIFKGKSELQRVDPAEGKYRSGKKPGTQGAFDRLSAEVRIPLNFQFKKTNKHLNSSRCFGSFCGF